MKTCRIPTSEEVHQMALAIAKDSRCEVEDIEGHMEDSAIAVFDHYTTDGPGFSGKVASIIWPGSPGIVTTLCHRSDSWDVAGSYSD